MKVYNLGVEATLDIMGGKWKPLIICFLAQGTKRTGELQRCIPKISQKVLIQQLRELEQDGIVDRTVFNELPPKVEYSITAYGLTLNAVIDTMCQWGKENILIRQRDGEAVELIEKEYELGAK
ncbi:helix-turn-helix transcriptional regulator [Listeria marthii]|nr:helix-turn-helix transcriptional regulator [Listeria marthii]